jgi:DNA polymerase-1
MSATPNERLFLVDAHSLIFQVFYAIRGGMSTPSGVPTNALFGFIRDMLFVRNELQPTHLICAFDVVGPTFRDQIYPDYKAHRDPPPDDLLLQEPMIAEALAALRIPMFGLPGFEADDVIATLARAASVRGMDVFICTSDKDCRQLLDDRIRMFNLRTRKEFGRAELLADWGITPEQVIDFQTLVGDGVDNVPGVVGIGEKTAAVLLQQFGSVANLFNNIDKVSGAKRKENLKAFIPWIPRTRDLVTLRTDVPIPLDWDAWKVQPPDVPRCLELFKQWGFRSFGDQVKALAGDKVKTAVATPVQRGLFDAEEAFPFGANGAEPSAEKSWQATYHLIDTPEKFETFLTELQSQRRFAIDLETTGLDPLQAELVGIAICWQEGEAYYLPVRGPTGCPLLDQQQVLNALKPLLEDQRIAKVNQNIKYDLLALRAHGVRTVGVAGDSMIADYLLHASERSHNLEELARRHLNHQVIPITDLIGKRGKNQLRMDQVPTVKVAEYSGEDADVAWRLCARLEPVLAGQGLANLYTEVEVPLIEVLTEMEEVGIRLDVPFLKNLSTQMATQLDSIEQDIYRLAGHEFNIGSLPQLRKVLYEELKLTPPAGKKTAITGAPSTDQETLEKLSTQHPLPRKILEQRALSKLKGTYVDTLPELVNPRTRRVHTDFNQTVAVTGRLSSSSPNLQNVPIRTEMGGQIRQAFLPEAGWLLMTADYSQIELRMLAHFSGDEALSRAFAEDRDIHTAVAAQIHGVPESEVTKEMRRVAKTVNFGVIYGMSASGLAARLEIRQDEATRFIDAYFARYPKVQRYQSNLLKQCIKTGYVGTILGRRRKIEGIRSASTYQQRNQPEREAINMEIQGSAADLMKLAMLSISQRLKRDKLKSRMLLTVHDELVFEVPPEERDRTAALVVREMTTPLAERLGLRTPLKVDVKVGGNWLEVEPLNQPRTAVSA